MEGGLRAQGRSARASCRREREWRWTPRRPQPLQRTRRELIRPVLGPGGYRPEVDLTTRFEDGFFLQPVASVARGLLGSYLLSTIGGRRCAGMVVETEAYGGADDPASHAATRVGVTDRNRAMFGPPGRAYVYRSYGVHWCLNVVTGAEGEGQAVLLRGVEPIEGEAEMARRRDGRHPLAAGPGRLAQAFGVDDALYAHDLSEAPLLLGPGWNVPDAAVAVSGRIGISTAADRLLRFYVVGNAGVTRTRPGANRSSEAK